MNKNTLKKTTEIKQNSPKSVAVCFNMESEIAGDHFLVQTAVSGTIEADSCILKAFNSIGAIH